MAEAHANGANHKRRLPRAEVSASSGSRAGIHSATGGRFSHQVQRNGTVVNRDVRLLASIASVEALRYTKALDVRALEGAEIDRPLHRLTATSGTAVHEYHLDIVGWVGFGIDKGIDIKRSRRIGEP